MNFPRAFSARSIAQSVLNACLLSVLALPLTGHATTRTPSTSTVIYRSSQATNNGFYDVAKFSRLSPQARKAMRQGVITVKTIQFYEIQSGSTTIPLQGLESILKRIGTTSIRTPFAPEPAVMQAWKNSSKSIQSLTNSTFGLERIYYISYSANDNPEQLAREIAAIPGVEYATPEFERKLYGTTPNDTRFSEQYALTQINAPNAWDVTKGTSAVIIAIVDSGTDWQHTDLKTNVWTNPKEIAGNGIDDDGNGKIDDVNGWDLIGDVSSTEADQEIWREDNNPIVPNLTNANDERQHGTHVAGCAAAATNNANGIAGTAWNCVYMPVKCGSDKIRNAIYRGYEGIYYAAKTGAHIINCSWGGPGYNPAEQDIVNEATALGSLVVAAAGNESADNDNTESFPSNYDNILSVGASGSTDVAADFSNYGVKVTVFTPGEAILSTVSPNTYTQYDGTSMASPITAGVAALVKSIHPTWSPKQILQQIRSTADAVGLGSPREKYYGRTNVFRAVTENTSFDKGTRVPGIALKNIQVASSQGIIKTTQPVAVQLILQNYLAPASDISVSLTPLSSGFTLSGIPATIASLGSLDTAITAITVDLDDDFPWSDGTIQVMATYKSGTYTNYELLQIPFELETKAGQGKIGSQDLDNYVDVLTLRAASAPLKNSIWLAGNVSFFGQNVAVVGVGNQDTVLSVATPFGNRTTVTALEALDDQTAFAGISTSAGGTATGTLRRTINGNSSWTQVTLPQTVSSIANIHFFDGTNGIVITNPRNSSWGLFKSSNAGASWTTANTLPTPQSSEVAIASSFSWNGQSGVFFTNLSRVFITRDGGATWNISAPVGSNISLVGAAWIDESRTLLSTRNTAQSEMSFLVSDDAGATWTSPKVWAQAPNVLRFAAFARPEQSTIMALVDTIGVVRYATPENAISSNWSIERTSQPLGDVTAGTTFSDGKTLRIWRAGREISYVDIDLSSATSVNEQEIRVGTEDNFSLSPNPAHSSVKISMTNGSSPLHSITINDIHGNTVFRSTSINTEVISVQNWSAGVYFVHIHFKNGTHQTGKFIVMP